MLTVVLALGVRASILVAIAIPGAFLAGILAVYTLGFTLNIVVLFALILVIGMLVDGAIVVVELAER
jgi:multidrug efflux pump